jgi:hypothetical protein
MSSELASLIEANTRIDGTFPTPIPGLHLARYSSRTQPGDGVQSPTLAIVAQGTKQVMLGNEPFTYVPGYCLVVSLDLPVSGRVATASKARHDQSDPLSSSKPGLQPLICCPKLQGSVESISCFLFFKVQGAQ